MARLRKGEFAFPFRSGRVSNARCSTGRTLTKTSALSDLLGRLLRDFGRDHVRGYVLSALLLALISLSNTGVAAMLKPVLNGMVSAEKFGEMRTMAFEVVALFVLRGAATFGSTLTLSRIGNRIVATAQRRVFDRLLNQNLMFFQDRHSSEFVARLVIAANGVRDSLQLVVQSGARDLLTVVGWAAVMIYQDPLVAAGAVCALPILIFFIRKIIDRVRRFAKRSFQGSTQIMQTMSETVLGARIVKAFNLESEMRERMARSVRTVESSANRIAAGNGLTDLPLRLARRPRHRLRHLLRLVAGQRAARRRRLVRFLPRRAAARLRAGQAPVGLLGQPAERHGRRAD